MMDVQDLALKVKNGAYFRQEHPTAFYRNELTKGVINNFITKNQRFYSKMFLWHFPAFSICIYFGSNFTRSLNRVPLFTYIKLSL